MGVSLVPIAMFPLTVKLPLVTFTPPVTPVVFNNVSTSLFPY